MQEVKSGPSCQEIRESSLSIFFYRVLSWSVKFQRIFLAGGAVVWVVSVFWCVHVRACACLCMCFICMLVSAHSEAQGRPALICWNEVSHWIWSLLVCSAMLAAIPAILLPLPQPPPTLLWLHWCWVSKVKFAFVAGVLAMELLPPLELGFVCFYRKVSCAQENLQ